jgi:hypothetical protein
MLKDKSSPAKLQAHRGIDLGDDDIVVETELLGIGTLLTVARVIPAELTHMQSASPEPSPDADIISQLLNSQSP